MRKKRTETVSLQLEAESEMENVTERAINPINTMNYTECILNTDYEVAKDKF